MIFVIHGSPKVLLSVSAQQSGKHNSIISAVLSALIGTTALRSQPSTTFHRRLNNTYLTHSNISSTSGRPRASEVVSYHTSSQDLQLGLFLQLLREARLLSRAA